MGQQGSSDRVLRPMIVTKQLDLPEGPQGEFPCVAQPTPRTNLPKELEKYNRPPSQTDASFAMKAPASPGAAVKPKEPVPPVHIPERPNILSKRPHFKPQYRYDPHGGPLNLSTKSLAPPLHEPLDNSGTLDLSLKKEAGASTSQQQQQVEEEQQEPIDFSKKTLDSQSIADLVCGGARASPLVTSSQSPPPLHHLPLELPMLGETPVLGDSPSCLPPEPEPEAATPALAEPEEEDEEEEEEEEERHDVDMPNSPQSQEELLSAPPSEESSPMGSPAVGSVMLHSPSQPINGVSSPDMPGDEARWGSCACILQSMGLGMGQFMVYDV